MKGEIIMDKTIAKTILAQLGGKPFIIMSGAKDLFATENGLLFTVPREYGDMDIDKVFITLECDDTYTMHLIQIIDGKDTEVKKVDEVYCDMLVDVFTTETGIVTEFVM